MDLAPLTPVSLARRPTAHLPAWRTTLLSLLGVTNLVLLGLSAATLAYQLTKTVGYNKPVAAVRPPSLLLCHFPHRCFTDARMVPAVQLLFCSIAECAVCAVYLLPLHEVMRRVPWARHAFALWVELTLVCVGGLLELASVARLHAATPGLLSNCGGYFICQGMQGLMALAWL